MYIVMLEGAPGAQECENSIIKVHEALYPLPARAVDGNLPCSSVNSFPRLVDQGPV